MNPNPDKPFQKEGQEREVKVSFVIDDFNLSAYVKKFGMNSVLNVKGKSPVNVKSFYRYEYKVNHEKREAWKLLFENYDCDFYKFICLDGAKILIEGIGKLRYEGREKVDYDEAIAFIKQSKTQEKIDVTIRQRIESN